MEATALVHSARLQVSADIQAGLEALTASTGLTIGPEVSICC